MTQAELINKSIDKKIKALKEEIRIFESLKECKHTRIRDCQTVILCRDCYAMASKEKKK